MDMHTYKKQKYTNFHLLNIPLYIPCNRAYKTLGQVVTEGALKVWS